jgi:transcription elongation factor Elf1
LNNTALLFGLYCQPFAELDENERPIPVVESKLYIYQLVNDQIFRCRVCHSYINSKYEITYNKSNKKVAICNICANENELDTSKSAVKSDYFSSDLSGVPELSLPTVDFMAPSNMKHTVPFLPTYLFLIDISSISIDLSLAAYVI